MYKFLWPAGDLEFFKRIPGHFGDRSTENNQQSLSIRVTSIDEKKYSHKKIYMTRKLRALSTSQ